MDSKTPSDMLSGLSPNTSISDQEMATVLSGALDEFNRGASTDVGAQADRMLETFDEALSQGSKLSMLPNYSIHPTGKEFGNFLVVDLGGSTLRVAVISIEGPDGTKSCRERISIVSSKKWLVSDSRKTVDKNFFRWMSSKINEVLKLQNVISSTSVITAGVTWSFSLESLSHNRANILHMGKGYIVHEEVFGHDLKQILEELLLENENIKISVECIINDSLAVFAAGSFLDSTTKLAMVLGTGLNFCCQLAVLDSIDNSKHLGLEKTILLNTETSLFGSTLVPDLATKYDAMIDSHFAGFDFKPHMEVDPVTQEIFQPTELLASGRYLPELARLVIMDMFNKHEIFANVKHVEALSKAYEGFTGERMCAIAEATLHEDVCSTMAELLNCSKKDISTSDVVLLELLVSAIVRRSAFVTAVCILAYLKLLVKHNGSLDTKVVTIGFVGSVLDYFHTLRRSIIEFVNTSLDALALGIQIDLQPIEESSLVGAAIGAACRAAS